MNMGRMALPSSGGRGSRLKSEEDEVEREEDRQRHDDRLAQPPPAVAAVISVKVTRVRRVEDAEGHAEADQEAREEDQDQVAGGPARAMSAARRG